MGRAVGAEAAGPSLCGGLSGPCARGSGPARTQPRRVTFSVRKQASRGAGARMKRGTRITRARLRSERGRALASSESARQRVARQARTWILVAAWFCRARRGGPIGKPGGQIV